MTDRTVTIDTRDRGQVTTACPAWCVDGHEEPPPPRRRWSIRLLLGGNWHRRRTVDRRPFAADIHHASEPIEIVLDTYEGQIVLGGLQLWQDPFPTPTYPHGAEVHISAYLAGESVDYPIGPLDDLAAAFIEAAGVIRLAARDLAEVARGDEL